MKISGTALTIAYFVTSALLWAMGGVVLSTTSCAGTHTTLEAGVSTIIDPAHCQERKGDSGETSGPTVLLDCVNISGSGTVKIEFQRASWWEVKLRTSNVDAGPGK